jgi:UDP-N-acetylmuramate: L-alanyl-gamma-D-glutamyl-meso-diaminopimelate ligase
MLARVRAAGVKADGFDGGAAILDDLVRTLTGDEVVLLLSSGPLDGLARSLPALLDETFA